MMETLKASALAAAPWGAPLLDGIDFTLAPGEILALVGPNGAGKSSLLHVLAGGVPLSQGEVRLHGRALGDWSRLDRARSLALLPQHSPLAFPFRIEEVVQLGREPHASGASEDQAIVQEVLAATDTESLRDRLYTRLSGGERQRVQLARVMAQVWRGSDSPARVLLLDEPTAGLDLEHQQMVARAIELLSASGCAVVLVAHDFNFTAALAHRVLVLSQGRQLMLDSPAEVFTRQTFQEVFHVAVHIGKHPVSGVPLVVQP